MRNSIVKSLRFLTIIAYLLCYDWAMAQNQKIHPPAKENSRVSSSLAEGQSPFEALKGKREDKSKRDAFSKHYINEDGSFTALIGAGPIHYEKNGIWEDIDHKITPNLEVNYPYANTTNLFESYFGSTTQMGVKNKTPEGEIREFLNTQMYWEVNGQAVNMLNSANTPVRIENDRAYYDNIYGSISAEFTTLTGKRKLNYIIPNKQALGTIPSNAEYLVFSEDIILPFGWTSSMTEKGILIKDQIGKEIYLYENPHSTDAESHALREENTIFETLQIGNTLTIKTKVKTEWLLSNERVFPVMVDPTVNVWGNLTGTVSWNGTFLNFSGRNGDVVSGIVGTISGNVLANGFVKYNLSTIPVGSIINSAVSYTRIYANSTYTVNGHMWTSLSVDPQTSTAAQIWNDQNQGQNSTQYWVGIPYTGGTNGTLATQTLNTDAINAIQSSLSQGWFAMRLQIASYGQTWDINYAERLELWGQRGNTNPNSTSHRPYLSITYTEPCPAPTNLNVDTIDKTSARIFWTAPASAPSNGYQYYYNTTGVAPTGGPSGSVGAGITQKTLSGLSPNRVYHFWVRSNCGTSQGTWVYGGYFNTLPDYDCLHDENQGQIHGPVDDGLRVKIGGSDKVADDFTVPAGKIMDVKQITIEAISAVSTPVNQGQITIRENNSGLPGAVLHTFTMAPTSSYQYVTNWEGYSGWNVYHLTFNVPTPIILSEGTYWLDVSLRNAANNDYIYWVLNESGMHGARPKLSVDNGATWYEDIVDYQMNFFVAGDCTDADDCPFTTIWNGTAWSNGIPNSSDTKIIFNGNYTSSAGNTNSGELIGCSVEVLSGNVTISQGHNIIIDNEITVAETASFTLENDAHLVQISPTAANEGIITVKRISAPMIRQDATGWSSPVANQNLRNFSPGTLKKRYYIYNGYGSPGTNGSNFKAIFEYDPLYPMPSPIPADWPGAKLESEGLFDELNYTFQKGWGYSIRVPNNWSSSTPQSFNAVFVGEPHNGDVVVPAYGKYSLVGNPYPSAIDAYKFFQENSDITTLHFWTHHFPVGSPDYNNNYVTYSLVGGAGQYPEYAGLPPNGKIALAQAFVVEHGEIEEEEGDEPWSVVFNNSMRTNEFANFYKTDFLERHRFWLSLTNSNEEKTAQILVGYMTGATQEADHQIDGKRMGTAPLYSLIAGEKYTVQGRALPFDQEDVVPLGFTADEIGKFKIQIDRVDGLFAETENSISIYLRDRLKGIEHNLSNSPYEFESSEGEFLERFEIFYKTDETLSIEDEWENNSILIYQNSQNIVIQSKTEKILSVELWDLSGRKIHQNLQVNAQVYEMKRKNFDTLILLVKILTQDGKITTRKIIHSKN